MGDLERLGRFLERVRKRALLENSVRVGALALIGLVAILFLLALWANLTGPAGYWPYLATFIILAALGIGGGLGFLWPAHRWRSHAELARLVGERHPALRGDLLSAIELGSPRALSPGSPNMGTAFRAEVLEKAEPLDVNALYPLHKATRMVFLAGGTLLVFLLGLLLLPHSVGRGTRLLFHTPTLFEGALLAHEPLVGDLRVTYDYPAYTKLPRQTIEGSTGDLHALKGTRVRLEMRPLQAARKALLLLGESGEEGMLETTLEHDRFVANFDLTENNAYRVWLRSYLGRPRREENFHRISVESDRPPEVELVAAQDRLELTHPRPVELAYHARDDFGLDQIAIVYRINDGPPQRLLLKDGQGSREVQGTTNFEPASALLVPGAKVAYHVEAQDKDDVSGSKVGVSRTLYIVIQNPREAMEDRLGLERDLLEKFITCLGDRLEMDPARTDDPSALRKTRDLEESAIATLGRLVEELRRAGGVNKTLATTLGSGADHLGKLLREEAENSGKGGKGAGKKSPSARHVAELEAIVIALDDLMGRQRMDDLSAIGKELVAAHAKLQELLARYKATGDESLRRQLERDVRELRDRIAELARKIAEVKARNDVNMEWMNLPDAAKSLAKAAELDSLLAKGDSQSLDRALAELGDSLSSMKDLLDQGADGFQAMRFPQERKALAELQRKLSDLEGDERNLAGDGGKLAKEIDGEIGKRMADKQLEALNRAKQKVEAIAGKLVGTPTRELSGTGETASVAVKENLRQLRRLLPSKEWTEARRETDRMVIGLSQLQQTIGRQLAGGRPPSQTLKDFEGKVDEAGQLARELAADLAKLLPKTEDVMSPEQRSRSHALGERQQSIAQRTRELAQDLQNRGDAIPDGDKTRGELDEIGGQMRMAEQELFQGAPREGSGRAEDVSQRLAKLRQQMGERPSAGTRQNRDPVHIPDSESSRAPRAWREELMEAMREKAPEDYREQVRHYYEELVK